jgi:hypothetical protein
VLAVSAVLKGQCDEREIPVILHYGLTPVEIERGKGAVVEIQDTGSHGGRLSVADAAADNLWFLRRRSGFFGREPGTGKFGVVDPEDVQPLALKDYFLCYLGRDPASAVKEYVRKHPDMAARAQRYFDHVEIQAVMRLGDPAERYERLLPYFLKQASWDMKFEASDGLVACGPVAGERLKALFANPAHASLRQQVIRLWRDMAYRPVAPLLIALLQQHERFWAQQRLEKGWWNDQTNPELTRRRQDIYGEVYTAVYTLRQLRDPRAREVLEAARARWITFENKQIAEECEAALRELANHDEK